MQQRYVTERDTEELNDKAERLYACCYPSDCYSERNVKQPLTHKKDTLSDLGLCDSTSVTHIEFDLGRATDIFPLPVM